jgi:hypothetical protein
MQWQQHPQFPWIQVANHPQGGWVLHDSRDGTQIYAPNEHAFHTFVAQRSNPQLSRMGAGDIVARATHALGIEQCTPCARRQAEMNAMLPNLWRR